MSSITHDAAAAAGLILFAHGARDPAWAAPFEAVAAAVRHARPALPLRLAFLESMQPDLARAGAELCAAGCTRVDIVPLFLGTGGHLKRDLPPLVEGLRGAHPQTDWILHAPAGESPLLTQALCNIALAALPAQIRPGNTAP